MCTRSHGANGSRGAKGDASSPAKRSAPHSTGSPLLEPFAGGLQQSPERGASARARADSRCARRARTPSGCRPAPPGPATWRCPTAPAHKHGQRATPARLELLRASRRRCCCARATHASTLWQGKACGKKAHRQGVASVPQDGGVAVVLLDDALGRDARALVQVGGVAGRGGAERLIPAAAAARSTQSGAVRVASPPTLTWRKRCCA